MLGPLPLPALPSNTKGPASFLGVVGPSAPSISKGLDVVFLTVDDASAVGASSCGGCEVVVLDLLEDKDFPGSISRDVALETSPGRDGVVRELIRRVRRFVAGAGGAAVCPEVFGGLDSDSGLVRFEIERFLVVIVESASSLTLADALSLTSSFDSASIGSSPLTTES